VPRVAHFPFTRVLTPIGLIQAPIVHVVLSHGTRAVEVEMTVDSGADLTMIPHQLGKSLGLRATTSTTRRLSGVAGGLQYRLARLQIRLGQFTFPARVAWARHDDVPELLGRLDVFNKFAITFDEAHRRITFRER